MTEYRIAAHAHVCTVDGYSIILDLKANKYLALGPEDTCSVARIVPSWPRDPSRSASLGDDRAAMNVASSLESCGVLTRDERTGRQIGAAAIDELQAILLASESARREPMELLCVARFFVACAVTAYRLRFRSLYKIAQQVRERKRRHSCTATAPFDMERARSLVRTYARLRPFLFTEKRACLFDSLALLQFLSFYRLYPVWVIGVEMDPFAAHSWVQQSTCVFNDTLEHARGFTPIMTV